MLYLQVACCALHFQVTCHVTSCTTSKMLNSSARERYLAKSMAARVAGSQLPPENYSQMSNKHVEASTVWFVSDCFNHQLAS